MRRRLILVCCSLALFAVSTVIGTDDPHGTTDAIYCEQCHVTHNTLGDILINSTDSLISTLCLSCHTPGGWSGMTKFISAADKADPGVTGTSHGWDVPVANAQRGSSAPSAQVLLNHLTADSRVTCATCHDPHENAISPFLRMDNTADALCLECHASRNLASVRTYTGNPLSHPVGRTIPADDYHDPPLDVDGNPQPSDGNTTNDLNLVGGTTVSCTTCHGVHYKDSDSGTTD